MAPLHFLGSILILACAVSAAPALGDYDSNSQRDRLDERLAAFTAAFQEGDVDALDSMLAPHYTHTNNSSPALERADWLASMQRNRGVRASASGSRPSFSNSDVKVRVSGDTAVVTGLSKMRGERDGQPFGLSIRYTHVWVWAGDDWFRVAFQDTYSPLDE